MNKDSLLPKSLFSASTLKLEPVEQNLSNKTTRREPSKRRKSSSLAISAPPPSTIESNKKRKINVFDSDDERIEEKRGGEGGGGGGGGGGTTTENALAILSKSSSSSSSSSSEDDDEIIEEEMEMQFARNETTTQLNQAMHNLLIKLERQQARQNRYLDKVKRLNKAMKKTNRIIGYHANLIIDSVSKHISPLSPSPIINNSKETTTSTRQLAKRTIPFHTTIEESRPVKQQQQKKIVIQDDDDEKEEEEEETTEEGEDETVIESSRDTALIPPSTAPIIQQRRRGSTALRPQFPIQHTPKRTPIIEIDFATRSHMDLYTVRTKNSDIMSVKKPRSLLYNIAETGRDMDSLMITTSLDGELQFWNTNERRKIKTIGQDHLYDTWIDDICWATPSTLAFNPPQKSKEPVKLVHINHVTKTNVEGRIQTLNEEPHENGVSVIASLDTGTYTRNSEMCSFVTGGYDKSVYIWNLKRESPTDNFTQTGVHRLNIKHTSAIFSLCYDKYRNILFSGGSDSKVVLFDIQSNTSIRELRLSQRVSQVIQSKANPNIMLITTTNSLEQFSIYDQRIPGFEGIKLKFGQNEEENLSRFIRPDMHENGYMVCCGGQGAPKLNFWDLRYTDVSRSPSFSMETMGKTKSLRSMFLPNNQDVIVSMSSSRYMTWIDYAVKKDQVVKSFT